MMEGGAGVAAIRERVGDSVQTCVPAAAAPAAKAISTHPVKALAISRATRHARDAGQRPLRAPTRAATRTMVSPPADGEASRHLADCEHWRSAEPHAESARERCAFNSGQNVSAEVLSLLSARCAFFVPLQTCCPSSAIIENKLLIIFVRRAFVPRRSASNPDWSHLKTLIPPFCNEGVRCDHVRDNLILIVMHSMV